MSFWSHIMIAFLSTEPSGSAAAGAVMPDSLSLLNWLRHYRRGEINGKIAKTDRAAFDRAVNSGKIWEAHQAVHSYTATAAVLSGAVIAKALGKKRTSAFLTAWGLHTFADYFTHTTQGYPLTPSKKSRTVNLKLFDYHPPEKNTLLLDLAILGALGAKLLFRNTTLSGGPAGN